MKFEAEKEMDRRCVWSWLNDVYRNPTVAFNTYSDEQQMEFAHDALVMVKELDTVEPRVSTAEQRCGHCNKVIEMDGWQFCPWCGKRIDWNGWWKKNGARNQDT